MRRQVEAVIFDWGGTLSVHADVDLADLWRPAAEEIDPSRADEIAGMLHRIEQRSWERVAVDQESMTLDRILDEACRSTGINVRPAVMHRAAEAYLDGWAPHITHQPDAVGVLQALRDAGYKTGLLSNTHWPRAIHEHFLDRDGLGKLLDATVYTSELPKTKPNPVAFKAVLHLLDVPDPRYAVFVGDRLYDDVWGASQMGMRTALIDNPALAGVFPSNSIVRREEVRPDAVIADLSELLGWVAAWS
jgi:putative hydrolase of the HAD superfamily